MQNITYLSPFNVSKDLRTNSFQERRNNNNPVAKASKNMLNMYGEPMTSKNQ